MSEATDQMLWDAAANGDADAFGELFTRHHRAVYNYCFRRTSSWETAEDLMSTVFLESWRTRQPMALQTESFLPWLIGIATRVSHRHHRKQARDDGLTQRAAAVTDSPNLDHADDVAARIDDERRMAHVLSVLADLPQKDQDVIEVCIFADLDYAAAAEALNIPIGTVRSRLSRARKRLSRTAPRQHILITEPLKERS